MNKQALVIVLQNTDWEYLGFIEDHLEGRNIRFNYIRPVHDLTWQRGIRARSDGLIVLGGAPYGTVSSPVLPGLEARVEEIRRYIDANLPVIGFGTGAQMLLLAIGHDTVPTPPVLSVETAYRTDSEALNGYLPQQYPVVTFMLDHFVVPENIRVLSRTQTGEPALFQYKKNCFGFLGHPGMKSAIIEDSLVQFPEHAIDAPEMLASIRNLQNQIADSLVPIMTGLVQIAGWMQHD